MHNNDYNELHQHREHLANVYGPVVSRERSTDTLQDSSLGIGYKQKRISIQVNLITRSVIKNKLIYANYGNVEFVEINQPMILLFFFFQM
jgi:hypothetical protein